MKKSTILFSAVLAVIVGSSFTQANSSKLQDLDLNTTPKGKFHYSKDIKGYRQYLNLVIDGVLATAEAGVLVTKNYAINATTSTGETTKLEKLIKTYK
ncbi:hypothetical protein IQ37_18040 [Chryseobacterium piperi]|uniref:Uncharacterized protein n=1 Tax=Chryseobacterium piperi TaxID=558152 RepID=A0A086AHH7_9FLAO|nr:hypothetical protein [Chryseobacterium piperi]ASW74675.1 hypothetical protein CJF12_10530 [Chryseobacterium piperi]KFF16141.1 hypothetical protein IQ37_18040 [Chryseobacterium piperi]